MSYGAFPLEQLIKFYNQYEPKPISEDEFKQTACDLIDTRMMIYFKDGYLISNEFIDGEEEDFYKGLLEEIRMNIPICGLTESMTEYLEESGKRINSFKQIKELEDQLKKMRNHTRLLCYRGHTPAEINSSKSSQKIISFPAGKKVYPNDSFPCGSGKKYKHCCGRK